MSWVANGQDGNGSQLEKIGQKVSSLSLCVSEKSLKLCFILFSKI